MATIKKFEGPEIWQLSRKLNKEIYPLLTYFDEQRSFKPKNQLDGAAGSVMDNIAEGFERDGNREFIQFLAVSKGSLGEVKSQLYRAFDREPIDESKLNTLQTDCSILGDKIGRFHDVFK
jgi:four helix bundle protein